MEISLIHIDTLSVEATVRRAPNGDLIVLCTCGGTGEPAIENNTYIFRSIDEGKTWSEKSAICEVNGQACYQTCTVVDDGKIYVFVSKHNGRFQDWKNYIYISEDSGYTWESKTLDVLPEYAFVRSMVKLSNGKMLLPYHFYPVDNEKVKLQLSPDELICNYDVEYVENGFLIGDFNDGFERKVAFNIQSKNMPILYGNVKWNWTENTCVELESGHLLMMYRREKSGFLFAIESYDMGETWGETWQTDIPNPGNKPQLLKGINGEIVLINTPNNVGGDYLRKRMPLEVWISYDNVKSWDKKIIVSNFPGAYSYADGYIDETNCLRLAFEFNRHDVYFAKLMI